VPRIVLLLLAAHLARAEWVRVRTPSLELWTDAGEKNARRLLDRFTKVRRAVGTGGPVARPPRVFLFSSEREFRSYVEGRATDGLFRGGPERDYILLYVSAGLTRVPAHEYVHLILNRGTARFPKWLDEGFAEFYSTVEVGGTTLVGTPIESHVRALRTRKLLSANELELAGRVDATFDERSLAGVFYAESWALAHMLNLSPKWRNNMPSFVDQLLSGKESHQAFQSAFGKTLDDAIGELAGYVDRMRAVTLDSAAPLQEDPPVFESMAEPAPTLVRADLALHTQKFSLARSLFERAARENPDNPEAEAGLGTLAMAENHPDEARGHLEKALTLRAPGGELYFELAMLERESGMPAEGVDSLLQKAIEASPNYAEAHLLLGIRWTDNRDYARAIEHLEQAVRILPRQSYAWHALAYAQLKAGRTEEARISALRALETAETPEHARMAQALLESF
jgi:tetratricopeptide (TPR) repeat protein